LREYRKVGKATVSIPEEGPAMKDVKKAVLELAQELPDECTWDDVMYRIFVRQKIDAGLRDSEAGRLISHDEVFKEFANETHPLD
jgi:predicted transcriptional regulator